MAPRRRVVGWIHGMFTPLGGTVSYPALKAEGVRMLQTEATRRYRTVFISDVHLGTKGCRADFLADFLAQTRCEQLFLVGDIVDGWRLRKSWYWDAHHDEVIRLVLGMARDGASVTYIPGNHDEMFRGWLGLEMAGVKLARQAEHRTADGRRLLVLHGDEFDSVVRYAKFLAYLGDWAYDWALRLNLWFNYGRRKFGYPYWSLSQWLKRQVKGAVKAIDRFEVALAGEARRGGFDGVVCGHIHHAEMRDVGGVLYINDGDWVESCTALVEHADGRLELVDWVREMGLSHHDRLQRDRAQRNVPAGDDTRNEGAQHPGDGHDAPPRDEARRVRGAVPLPPEVPIPA